MSKQTIKNSNTIELNKLMLWNANKIENKIDEVYLSLDTNNIDILAINETKLDSVGENFI